MNTMSEPELLHLIDQLCAAEHRLLRRHHVRLRVDKVTANGRNALCVASQVRSRFLRKDLQAEEMIAACHAALSTLHRVGISPLIGTVPREPMMALPPLDPKDPFLLRSALHTAGLETILQPDHLPSR